MAEQNLTQTDLSNLTGIGKSSLSQYLSGKNTPHEQRVAEIADALRVSAERLNPMPREKVSENLESISPQKVSIEEAARRLGKSSQFVRISLQNGDAPFGFATRDSGAMTLTERVYTHFDIQQLLDAIDWYRRGDPLLFLGFHTGHTIGKILVRTMIETAPESLTKQHLYVMLKTQGGVHDASSFI